MLSKLSKKGQKGFTIIEVMIVLAIAGLILVVVLLAIPQLQRNQRNTSRRSVATRIVTEINNFAGNNNGKYPVADTTTGGSSDIGTPFSNVGFFNRYLGCTSADGAEAVCTANIEDPSTGFPVGSGVDGKTTSITVTGTEPTAEPGDIFYLDKAICDGEVATTTSANARNFVFIMRLEGGASFCQDNQ